MKTLSDSKALFKTIGRDPLIWRNHARRLKLIAKTLEPGLRKSLKNDQRLEKDREEKMAYIEVYMLLMGLSFENLIKGIVIAKNPELVSESKGESKLMGELKTHKLSQLARRHLDITKKGLDIIERLEEFVIWGGRYPIPASSHHYFKSAQPRNLRSLNSDDPENFERLFAGLEYVLEEGIKTVGKGAM
jgi:hypothetical protein